MLGKRQYSIRFMLLEIALVSFALGLIRAGIIVNGGVGLLLMLASLIVVGAAVGGVFGNMLGGAGLAVATLFVIGFLSAFCIIWPYGRLPTELIGFALATVLIVGLPICAFLAVVWMFSLVARTMLYFGRHPDNRE